MPAEPAKTSRYEKKDELKDERMRKRERENREKKPL